MQTNFQECAQRVFAPTYKRFPIVLSKGRGCTLWDTENRSYTDFVAGIAVCNLGHAHPRVTAAVCRQADTLWHVSNLYYTIPQTELAAWLVQHSFADRLFLCNSGAEANEAAIKIARRHFREKGEARRHRIISMLDSFHGRTMATLSATGQEKVRTGFDPVLDGFDFVAFGDIDALETMIGPHTCAVMMEPIQGEGGVRCPQPEYLKAVRRLCDRNGILLILDEIQTGMGRTGELFAHQHYGIQPDIMTLAKALANGLPIGAMLATETVAQAFGPGSHGSTFGGTPLVTAAALETVRVLSEDGLVEECNRVGAYFKERLNWLKQRHACIAEIRGLGLLLGMELTCEGGPVVSCCLERGFLINCIQDNILRFIPPLVITTEQIDLLVACLDDIFSSL